MKNLFQRWEQWWMREVPPHSLAIFRIVFGLFLLLYWGLKGSHIAIFASREGIILPWLPDDASSLALVIFTPPTVGIAYVIYGTLILALIFLTVGMCTRIAAATSLMLYAYYWILSIHLFGTSFDRLFMFTLFVLIFGGSDRTLSLRNLRKFGSFFAWEPICILPLRILAVQIMLTYLGVGWQKLVLPAWRSGEVLAYGYIGTWATPPAYWVARTNIPLWFFDGLNWCVKAFEISIPFGLWNRKVRWYFFAGGALFHIYIAIFLAIWWFLVLIPAYILFIEPEEVFTFLRARSRGRIPQQPM